MKRSLIIYFIILCGLFSFNRGYCQDSTSKISYGLKVNSSLYYLPDYKLTNLNDNGLSYIIDYSLFFQDNRIGVMGGYSNLYHFYDTPPSEHINLKGFNVGLFIKLIEFKKKNTLNLYVYNNHYSRLNPYYTPWLNTGPGGPGIPNTYYKLRVGFLNFNLKYKKSFFNDLCFIEAGIMVAFVANRHISFSNDIDYGGPSINIGGNISLSFNPSALFNKSNKAPVKK